MSRIQYTGTAESAEEIRAALAALKPQQEIIARREDDGERLELDHKWSDEQTIRNRWTLTVGQWLDAPTGAVVDEPPAG